MHGIVCGLGQVGYRISRLALQVGHRITVVTSEVRPEWQRELTAAGATFCFGDARDGELVIAAGLDSADWIIGATSDDMTNLEIVLDAKRTNPKVRTVARVFDQNLVSRLESTFSIDRVLAMSRLAAPAFISAAFGDRVVATFEWGGEQYGVVRASVDKNHLFAGKTLGEIETDAGLSVLLVAKDGCADTSPDRDLMPQPGDTVELVGPLGKVLALGDLPSATKRWPKRSRHRLSLPHIWKNAPRDLKALLTGLIAIIVLSAGVFRYGMGLSPINAFYYVITTVTTVGYGDITPKDASFWIKLYACFVMLLGSATIATLYSIITDALIRARIQELTAGLPIPEGGHVIVVGLGNVGFRTCEELMRLGVQPVGIDIDTHSKLLVSLRSQMPVVNGDAREPETLSQANLATASAIIVTTNNDAVSLSVGLIAREVTGSSRIVLRMFNDRFAHKVQSAVVFGGALSASSIAAPAFLGSAAHPNSLTSFVEHGLFLTLFDGGPGSEVLRRRDGRSLTVLAENLKISTG